jgi:hypothetical protein
MILACEHLEQAASFESFSFDICEVLTELLCLRLSAYFDGSPPLHYLTNGSGTKELVVSAE